MAEMSPLHRVIDAAHWDAERLLGRLIILVHAAFLNAGFVLHADSVTKTGRARWPRICPFVYAVSRRRDAAVPLHMRAHGMHIVFYVCMHRFAPNPGLVVHWVCVDARAAASLLSRSLDDTARALTDDDACTVGALWGELTEKLCRSALALCSGNAFLSLPVDVMLEILARLTDGLDLLRVASTCTGLRCLVADHDRELWKHRCMRFFFWAWDKDSSGMSWMQRW